MDTPIKIVYKYPIKLQNLSEILIPIGAKFLSCQVQDSRICLWMLVDYPAESQSRKIRVIGTGDPIKLEDLNDQWEFLGTVQMPPFVWHIFMEKV
jgi:hypothetical protein